MRKPGKHWVEKVWAQLTNPCGQLSHQIIDVDVDVDIDVDVHVDVNFDVGHHVQLSISMSAQRCC